MRGLDVDGPDLAAVLAGGEVGAGADVGVIEAQARGPRSEVMRRLPWAGM